MVGEWSCKDEEEGICRQMWRHGERRAHLMGLLDRANKHSRNNIDIPPSSWFVDVHHAQVRD